MGCSVDPIHHHIINNYCETTFSSCLFGFAKLSWLLLITVSVWPSVKSPLCSHWASPANAAVQRFWCTRLISMEVVLVTISLWLIKDAAAHRQRSILKVKQACKIITKYLYAKLALYQLMVSLASEADCERMLFSDDHSPRDQNCTFIL